MTSPRMPELSIKPEALKWFNTLLRRSTTEPIAEKVKITPDRAAVLLARNPGNRTLRDAKIAQFTSDLLTGRFAFNGESIIVSSDGDLNDGQHRLFAAIKANKSFETILVIGVDRSTRYTIDTGAARTAGDHLSIEGVPNAVTAAAIARYLSAWKANGEFTRRARISAQEQIEMVRTDEMLREIAGWVDSKKARLKEILRGALSGFIFYILADKAPREARIFMEHLQLGADLSADSPIFLAREKLRQHHRKLTDNERIEIVIRAWNHWCANPVTTLSRLQIMGTIPEIETPNPAFHGEGVMLLTDKAPSRATVEA